MKTILSIFLLITVVFSGLASYHLFRQSQYNLSELLTLTSYLSMVMCVYALSIQHKEKAKAIK